jgi:1-acyl-sn-glycerol-3-phosphate acyltransferase
VTTDARGVSLEEGPRLYRWIAALTALLVWPFVRVDTLQLDVARRTRTAVVIANHRSLFDAAVGLIAFRRLHRYPRVIVASHWFDRRWTGPLLRMAGAIPMDRDDPSVHLDAAKRLLDAGIPILILPEGRLSGETGVPTSTGEFKTGAARLAAHCEVGVWPLAHVGTEDIWPRGDRRPRFGTRRSRRVVLLGHERIIEVDDDVRASTARLQAEVVSLIEQAVPLLWTPPVEGQANDDTVAS